MRKGKKKGSELRRVDALHFLLLIFVSLATFARVDLAHAIQSGITYHGRILKPDGTPLESTNVKFKLQIRTPGTENCLLYEEQQTRNLAGSGGVFSITLGDGSGIRGAADEYAPGQSLTLDRAFQNKAGFPSTLKNCDSGSAYSPNIADGRRFQVEFRDASMTAWEKLPAAAINYVPFALESKSLSGFQPQHLLRFDDAAALLNTTPLSVTDYSDLMALIAGTSTKYTRAGQLNGVALPTLSNGQSLQWNSGAWTAVTPLTSESDPTVQAYAKTALPNCASGEVLKSNGTGFLCVTDSTSGTPVDATTTAKGIVQISSTGGISVSGGVISLPDQGGITAGSSYTKVTVDAKGRITAGAALAEADLPSITNAWSGTIDGSKISGTIGGSTAISTSGAITTGGAVGARTFNLFDADTNKISFVAPALSADYTLTWPAALPGVSGQILSVNTSGQLSWIAPSSGSVTSVTAAAPLSSTGGTTPQISIAQANGTTSGYLSNTDWSTFNNKLGTTLTNGSMWLGNGSNVATAVAPSGDVSVTNAGAFTVTRLQGQSVATTTPVTGQVLRYNSSNAWEAANFSVSDLRKPDGTSQFASASCSAGQTLNWSSLTDTFTCVNISIANTQVTGLGTASTKNFGTAAGNLVELDAGAKIPTSLLPTGAISQWTTTGSDIYYNTGNVGIGTTSPTLPFELVRSTTNAIAVVKNTGDGNNRFPGFEVRNFRNGSANGWPSLTLQNSQGTEAVPQPSTSGETLGAILFRGNTNAGTFGPANGAMIRAFAEENWSASALGSSLRFSVGANGTNTMPERMRIDGNGHVGIGTANPTLTLDVAGQIRSTTLNGSVQESLILTNTHSGAGSGASILFGNTLKLAQIANVVESTTTDSSLTFSTRQTSGYPTEKMRITAAGNVGIGTTAPTSELDVVGTVKARQGTFQINGGQVLSATGNTNGSSPYVFQVSNSTATADDQYLMRALSNSVERFHIANTGRTYFAGNVGIGTTTPGSPLDVKGEIRLSGATSGYTGFRPAAAAGSTVWQLPSTDGSSGQALVTNGSGVLTWQTPSGTGVSTLTVNAPITNGGTATAPNLSIAPASGSTNGYLSSSDWTTFNNKQGTGLTSANIWVGNGSNTAAAVAPSGDVSMTNTGAFTVTKLQSRTVASTLPVTSQVLRYNTATTSWEPQYVNFGDLKKSDGTSQFPGTPCTSAQTLTWSSLTDTFVCSNISIASTQVSGLGTAAAKNFGTAAGNLVELDAGAKIPASLLPSGAASQWTTTGSDIYYSTGLVGIGTTTPNARLDVQGTGDVVFNTGGNVAVGHNTPTFKLHVNGTVAANKVVSGYGASTADFSTDSSKAMTFTPDGTERVRIAVGGNVGIGTSSPSTNLSFSGESAQTIGMERRTGFLDGYPFYIKGSGTTVGATDRNGGNVYIASGDATGTGTSNIYFQTAAASATGTTPNVAATRMTILGNGNVGIGTATPGSALDVNGRASISQLGGGISVPLHVSNPHTSLTQDFGVAIDLRQLGTPVGQVGAAWAGNSSNANSYMFFSTRGAGTTAERMRIDQDGKVGIGTTTPGAMLDVKGAIRMSGATSGYTGFQPAAAAGSTVWTLPTADGSSGQALVTNGSGVLSWATPSGTGVTSVTATAPLSSSGGTTPQISITQANGTTSGYLSNTDWTTFNSKLGTSLTNGSIWVGNGSSVATAVAPAGDVTMSNAGSFTVTKLQNRTVASATPVTGQYLRYNTTNTSWEPQYFNVTDLRKSDGTSQFASASCSAGQTLNWSSLTDTFTCTNISIANTQVTGLGTASTKNFGTAAGNLVELDAGAKIPSSLLPSGTATQWTTTGSDIYYSAGKVGIGTSSPNRTFQVGTGSGIAQFGPNHGIILSTDSNGVAMFGSNVYSDQSNQARTASTHSGGFGYSSITAGWGALQFFTASGNTTADAAVTPTARMTITSGGNVGIATTTPNSSLSFGGNAARTIAMERSSTAVANPLTISAGGVNAGSTNANGGALILNSGIATGSGGSTIEFRTSTPGSSGTADNTPSTKMMISGNGNVGIGTTDPEHLLHMSKSGYAQALFESINDHVEFDMAAYGTGKQSMLFLTAARGTEAAPTYLQAGDTVGYIGAAPAQGGRQSARISFYTSDNWTGTSTPGVMAFLTTPSAATIPVERMRIDENGNVGIGTSNPTIPLHVESSQGIVYMTLRSMAPMAANNGGTILLSGKYDATNTADFASIAGVKENATNGNDGGSLVLSTNPAGATYLQERMRITNSGRVGVGTASPNYPLDVVGDINASGSVRAAGVALSSDVRYKRDIQTIDDALEKLLNLRGVSYQWRTEAFPNKSFNDRQQIGVIAQEVETQFPEAVDTDHDGFKSVNYPALVAPIIEALRTLHERIVEVELKQTSQAREIASKADRAEVDALKEENSALKTKAARIEKENELIKAYLCAKDPSAPLCQ